MSRKPMTEYEWLQEARYVEGVDPKKPGRLFNYDQECFKRYIQMQAVFCKKDGFFEIASRILAARKPAGK